MTTHPDDAAFIRAVCAAPADDLPRLIYADWLAERGDDARAEFIRVQCEIVRLYPDSKSAVVAARRDALRRREAELWAGLDLSELPGTNPVRSVEPWVSTSVAKYTFRRGFVESLTLDAASWLRHADALTAAAPVTAVNLTDWPGIEAVHLRDRGEVVFGFAGHLVTRPNLVVAMTPLGRLRSEAAEIELNGHYVTEQLLTKAWPAITFTLPPPGRGRTAEPRRGPGAAGLHGRVSPPGQRPPADTGGLRGGIGRHP